MFNWLKTKTENRSYSAIISDALESAINSESTGARSTAIAAVAQLLAGEISSGRIVAPDDIRIDREVLDWIVRQAVTEGEGVALISRSRGRFSLQPIADHDWQQSSMADQSTWRARVTIYSPTGSETQYVNRDRLVVLRWSWNPYAPGFGRSPAALAGVGSQAASRAEARQRDHASTPIRPLIAMPETTDTEGDKTETIRKAIGKGGGAPLLLETTAGGAGSRADAPHRDWNPAHLRPEPTAELNQLAQDTFDRMVAACGIPPAIFRATSDGTSLRESLRQSRLRAVEPLRLRLVDELRAQLDPGIDLVLDNYALDMVSRAQSINKLVAAGVDLGVAMSALGVAN